MNWNRNVWCKEWNHMTYTARTDIHNLMPVFCHIWELDMPKSTLLLKLISSHTYCSFLWGTDPPSWRQLKLPHSTFVGYMWLRGMFENGNPGYMWLRGMFWKQESRGITSWSHLLLPMWHGHGRNCTTEWTQARTPVFKISPLWLYLRIMHFGQNGGLENFPSSPHRMVDFLGA